ncbi:MAG: translation initiation factor IF-2 [Chloroflexi bacterium]|nr:translation initiation factor IF-2 [Chloroflexota bacterium]
MTEMNSAEEPKNAEAAPVETPAAPAKEKKPSRAKKPESAPAPAPARPSARPSIYDVISATAKRAEEDKAAKAAAHKERAQAQDKAAAAKPPASPAAARLGAKKPASPFLAASIVRPAVSKVPTMAPESELPTAPETQDTAPVDAKLVEAAPVAEITAPPSDLAAPLAPPLVQSPAEPKLVAPTAETPAKPAEARAEHPKHPGTTAVAPKSAEARVDQTRPAPRPQQRMGQGQQGQGQHQQRPRQGGQGVQGAPRPQSGAPSTTQSRPGQGTGNRPPGSSTQGQRPGGPGRGFQQPPPSRRPVAPRSQRRAAIAAAPVAPPPPAPAKPAGPIVLPPIVTVRELAETLNVPVGEMLKKLLKIKILATINQTLDYNTASLIAEEFDLKTKALDQADSKVEAKTVDLRSVADKGAGHSRPPVVTVLGHVDHGKTSLLDAIRNTSVAAGEAGGITQHIGAYQIEKQGRLITFLDTPGHEAFTAMRARGAQLTDVAVLVVAADDGVMPQTVEAINHARAANVPIVVALNKVDRESADPARVMRQLSDHELVVEEWGGTVPMVKVSARKNTGIEELLDMILLVADLEEHRADPLASAVGTVVEAEVDRSRGPVATLLVQNGTLHQSDYLVVGQVWGRVRAMFDDHGARIAEALPSKPVLVLGLPTVPEAGSTFQVVSDERTARDLAGQRAVELQNAGELKTAKALSLDDLYAQMQAGRMHELNLILKADVNGSLEPIRNSLERLSTDALHVRILHQGLGNVSESDVSLALASAAIVIAFNVEVDSAAKRVAAGEGVDVRQYSIIYKLIEDVDKALKGLLEPTFKEVISGRAEVRALFKVSKKLVAGCFITEGKAVRSGQVRLMRGGKQIWDGRVAGLKRFTEDVREVLTNFECGIMLENYEEFKPGDLLVFYHKEKEA